MNTDYPNTGVHQNREILSYIIPRSVVEFCRLGGRRAVTRINLRTLTPEDVVRAIESSPGKPYRAELVLLQFALVGVQVEDEPLRTLDPASDDLELRPGEVFKQLPAKVINLMRGALAEHLLPELTQVEEGADEV